LGSNYQESEVYDPVIKRGRFGIQLSREGGLRSGYQEGEVWDPVIKKGRLGFQLSREREVWDPLKPHSLDNWIPNLPLLITGS
jgi:hypothetical protein